MSVHVYASGWDFVCIALLYNSFILLHYIISSFFLSFYFFSLLLWAICMKGSWRSSQASGPCLWGGRAKFRTLVHKRPLSSTYYQTTKSSQRSPSQHQDPASLNDQQATVLDTLCHTTSKTGTQTQPLAERLPKIIIRPQTPQNTPPDMDVPTRKTRSSLIHQNSGTSSLHQEAYTAHWTKQPLGTDTKNNRNYEPVACEKETPNTVR